MERLNDKTHKKPSAGMTVPDGFFADFQRRMEQQIDAYEAAQASQRSLWSRFRHLSLGRRVLYAASIAACACLIVSIIPALRSVTSDTTPAAVLAEDTSVEYMQDQDVSDFMLANVSDYDIYMAYYYEE